jgi:hypothetical protein
MNTNDFEITDGYIGSFGKTWKTATDETLAETISHAAKFLGKTEEEIKLSLENGDSINWCESPNFYYDHSYGMIRRKLTVKPEEMVMCSCGHKIQKNLVMSASRGTSCPDCYDRMSD